MTTTARNIIEQAQKDAGVLGLGQTMNAEDTNDAFIRLQNMISQWQVKRWLVPSLYDIAMIGNNQRSNTIGPGQYWNTLRPDKIMGAYFVYVNNPVVSFPLYPVFSYEDYARISLKQLNNFPTRFFYDNQYPHGNVFIWPIPSPSFEIHLLLKSILGFSTSISDGNIANAGNGYTDGIYVAVPLINLGVSSSIASGIGSFIIGVSAIGGSGGGGGVSATANVTIVGGIITSFEIENGGELYTLGDVVTLDPAIVGIGGKDFLYVVTGIDSSLDSFISMPPEYKKALITNLAIELCQMYQMEPTQILMRNARVSMKTIIAANTQVPTLQLPRLLSGRRNTGIVNANGGVVWADLP